MAISTNEKLVNIEQLKYVYDTIDTKKVDKVSGKGLSSNDFTDELKTKLDGIESGADVNQNSFNKITVNGVNIVASSEEDGYSLLEGSNVTLTADADAKTITIASSGGGGTGNYDDTAIKTRLTTAETNIGLKANSSDVYTKTESDGLIANKADNATTISGYGITDAYTKTEVDNKLSSKHDSATSLSGYGITNAYTKTEVDTELSNKVDKEIGKSLSSNDFTDDLKNKLDGVEDGAEENVQSNWTETDTSKDSYIQNKPNSLVTGVKGSEESVYRNGNVEITITNIGLGSVENKSSADIRGEITDANVVDALGYTPADKSWIGTTATSATEYHIAPLDDTGKIPESFLPAYISDIMEYTEFALFPTVGNGGYLYRDTTTGNCYRWTGTSYSQISSSLTLGETASTAFAGNKGKAAYDHAMKAGTTQYNLGFYKLAVNDEGHVTNAVAVTASDINALGISGGDGSGGSIVYSAGEGIDVSGVVISNKGVRGVSESTTNGAIKVNTNGSSADVLVHGLKSAAFTDSTDYAPSSISTDIANKVDKVSGKDLSTNDFTNELKAKLDGVEEGAEENVQADWDETSSSSDSFIKNKPSIYLQSEIDTKITELNTNIGNKVDKVSGKDLSTNDFTTTLKDKLDGVEDGAEENQNAFSKILVNGVTVSSTAKEDTFTFAEGSNITLTTDVDTKTITISSSGGGGGTGSYDDSALKARLTTAETNIANKANSSDVYTKTEVDTKLSAKQDSATTISGYGITDAYTKTEVNTLLDDKLDASDVYTKTQIDTKLDGKADESTTISGYGITDAYTKTEVDNLVNAKADSSTTIAGYGITNAYTKTEVDDLLDDKVDKVSGKGLSSNDFTNSLKTKLDGIQDGAEKNLVTSVNTKVGDVVLTSDDIGIDASLVGKSASSLLSEITKAQIITSLGYTPLDQSKKGVANGVAELDVNGKVPSSQLPAYMDSIEEVDALPSTGESNKIYYNTTDSTSYRWTGSTFVPMLDSLALGETSSTAFRGDYGKIAYDHAQAKGIELSSLSLYQIVTNAEGHITNGTSVAIDTLVESKTDDASIPSTKSVDTALATKVNTSDVASVDEVKTYIGI